MVDRESLRLQQEIDCNCNDCVFMVRDFALYERSLLFHGKLQEEDFANKREHLRRSIEDLENRVTEESKDSLADMKRRHKKMRYQFDKSEVMINYGHCNKLIKAVTFIPGVCQIATQGCFEHRRSV